MLEEIYQKICGFYGDKELVFGEGRQNAAIMLVGEAPGKDEVANHRPFCGRAGKNLDEFLEMLELVRDDLYITNVCKFRPFKVSAKGTVSNRPPTKAEIVAALPFLHEEIVAVAPSVVVTLGNTPLRACLNDFTYNIGAVHGKMRRVPINSKTFDLFALYHPASVIYNPSLREVYRQDLFLLKNYVQSTKEK